MLNSRNLASMVEKLIKSKKRVKEFAEVFTPEHIVKKMVSLVDENFDDEDYGFKTWFDPAVGTGNFPAEILERKMQWCDKHQLGNKEKLRSLASIYAVDIQEDNVEECRERLKKIVVNYLNRPSVWDITVAESILEANIIIGDTINEPEKIVFLSWSKHTFPTPDNETKLSDMLEKDYMKDLEKRRKKVQKKIGKL